MLRLLCLCVHMHVCELQALDTSMFLCARESRRDFNTDVQTCKRLSIQLCRYSVSHCVAIKAQWQRKEQKDVQERLI